MYFCLSLAFVTQNRESEKCESERAREEREELREPGGGGEGTPMVRAGGGRVSVEGRDADPRGKGSNELVRPEAQDGPTQIRELRT